MLRGVSLPRSNEALIQRYKHKVEENLIVSHHTRKAHVFDLSYHNQQFPGSLNLGKARYCRDAIDAIQAPSAQFSSSPR